MFESESSILHVDENVCPRKDSENVCFIYSLCGMCTLNGIREY